MARPAVIIPETLSPIIRARGPISATELAGLLGTTARTITRILPDFGDDLVTLGATRSTRYLLRRNIRNIGSRYPIYRIDENGRPHQWAELESMHDRAWRITWADSTPVWAAHFTRDNGLWDGFPFFMEDLRPQGFLGRIIAGQISGPLRVPADPRDWNDDDNLIYLDAMSEDLPGNLVIGDAGLRRSLARSPLLAAENALDPISRHPLYLGFANEIARKLPESSAGGEQPKFLETLRGIEGSRPVLVKFSAPMDQPAGRRWGDLLIAEFIAHEILAEAGLAGTGAEILSTGDRTFLEVPRFDRTASGGRRGLTSLHSLLAATGNLHLRDWPAAAAALHRLGLIDDTCVSIIQLLHAFGELIGNSDMHAGNLSFFLEDTLPFRLAPAYDMLPMLWAPGPQGEIVSRRFGPAPPLPSLLPTWREAAALAERFWDRLHQDDRISANFAVEALTALETIRRLRRHVG